MKVSDILNELERLAPREYAYDWDNVGLTVGDKNADVNTVLLTLDMDEYVAREAASVGAQLVVAHHPLMYSPINHITTDTDEGRALITLIKKGISFIAMHTNLDTVRCGLNDMFAEKLGLANVRALDVSEFGGKKYPDGESVGIGRIGKVNITFGELIERAKKEFNVPYVRYIGDKPDKISTVALSTGGGMSCFDAAKKASTDVFVTGDIKYANAREAHFCGMKMIELGHYETEIMSTDWFEERLETAFGDKLTLIKSTANKNIWNID